MRDATVGDTLYFLFTTRSFSTGAPTTLAGTPALSVYEENNLTQITAGVSISADYDSVTGLNQATIVASGANGYEAGKSYSVVITTGTVGGVSVVGEVVAEFTLEASSAFTRLGAPAGASIAADLVTIDNFVDDLESRLTAARAGYLDNLNGHTPQTGDSYARLGAPAGASVSADIAAVKVDTAATLVDTAEIGAAGAGLTAVPWNAAWDAEVQSEVNDGLVALGLDHLVSAAVTGTDVTDNSIIAKMVSKGATADWDTFVNTTDSLEAARDKLTDIETDTAEIGAAGAGLTAIPWNASWDAEVQSEVTDGLNAYDPPTKAEMDALLTTALTESYAADGSAPTVAQALFMMLSFLQERSVSGTTLTCKKLDGSTTSMTFTLDDATSPTSITRST